MAEGNGVDGSQIVAMLGTMITKIEKLENGMTALRHDSSVMKRDILTLRQDIGMYHSSVVGHGLWLSDIDARLRRLEDDMRQTT